jgi:hypothetical protein
LLVWRSIISNYSETTGKGRDIEQLAAAVRLVCCEHFRHSGFCRIAWKNR